MMTATTKNAWGFPLPPRGWPLVALIAAFILAGLIGHDPWKNDDALTIGVAADMLRRGHWVFPHLANLPYPDAPLYYWTAALSGSLFSWLLPLHDAIRLVSGAWVALTLFLLYRAAREWHAEEPAPHEFSIASVLSMAGCLGFLVHAHEAQPMLVALAGHAAAYWALALAQRKPARATLIFGMGLGLGMLGNGLAAMLPLFPIAVFSVFTARNRKALSWMLAGGTLLGLLIASCWPLYLALREPVFFRLWLNGEFAAFSRGNVFDNALSFLVMLPWFAWPALPLALWTLRSKRRQLRKACYLTPLLALVSVWLTLSVTLDARSSSALLLLPPLALLAAPGVASLRRGAANAFDWFGIMIFSFFCILAWLGWSAMVTGWPEKLAQRVIKLAPGFSGSFEASAVAVAVLASVAWVWMLTTGQRQRSPWRGLVHWLAGLTAFWLLLTTLWLPWIEYGKSYRSVGLALKSALPARHSCVIGRSMSDVNRALIDYWAGIPLKMEKAADSRQCGWMFVLRDTRKAVEQSDWVVVAEMRRPSQRNERFILYRRLEAS